MNYESWSAEWKITPQKGIRFSMGRHIFPLLLFYFLFRWETTTITSRDGRGTLVPCSSRVNAPRPAQKCPLNLPLSHAMKGFFQSETALNGVVQELINYISLTFKKKFFFLN